MRHAKLKGEFKRFGLIQKDFARMIGMKPGTLNLKLNEKSEFTETEIMAIMRALGIDNPMEYFFYERERKDDGN